MTLAPENEKRCQSPKGDNTFTFDGVAGDPSAPEPYSLSWKFFCNNGTAQLFDAVSGALYDGSVPLKTGSVRLEVAQPKVNVEVSCSVLLTVQDGAGQSAECAKTILVNTCDLGCKSEDLSQALLGLDGSLNNLRLIVEQTAKLLRSLTKNKKAGAAEVAKAGALYQDGWNRVWSFPSVVNHCTNEVACVSASTDEFVSTYSSRAQELLSLNEKLCRLAKKAAKKSAKHLKRVKTQQSRGQAEFKSGLDELSAVPNSQSFCQ